MVLYRALDRNEYNHITATYFLLAERKLRMQRSDQRARMLRRAAAAAAKAKVEKAEDLADGASSCKVSSPTTTESELEASSSVVLEETCSSPPLPPIQMSSSVPAPT